jgi:uncharacterized protein
VTEHPNVELTRRGYDAFAKGDLAALSGLIADDVTWHVTGAGPLTGTYHGRDEVFGFFGRPGLIQNELKIMAVTGDGRGVGRVGLSRAGIGVLRTRNHQYLSSQ